MSEVKLNLIDSRTILTGTIHGSTVDSCIAALSAEPETIPELAAALSRYQKPLDDSNPFGWFHPRSHVDERPYDAGLVIIDLASRIIAAESTYSNPQPEGEVHYHNGQHGTDVSIPYRIPADWLCVNSIDAHCWSRERRLRERKPFFDARVILYGRPLLEFIVRSLTPEVRALSGTKMLGSNPSTPYPGPSLRSEISDTEIALTAEAKKDPDDTDFATGSAPNLDTELVRIHANWLTAPREDLQGRSPRDVILEKLDFIDFDLHTRSLQWTFLSEGPPCLAKESFAYRFAGFGTHEWVIYYDLVRHLLRSAVELDWQQVDAAILVLDQIKTTWLENGNPEYDGRTPAVIIENERKRLPEAMAPEQLIIDEDCECCRMMAQDAAMGFGPGFWHLDGSHMEEEFAFSFCKTIQEWETELQQREASYREFERQWAEREYERRMRQREWDEEQLRIECGESTEEEVTLDWPNRR